MVVKEELLVVPRADALRIPPRKQVPRSVYGRGVGLLESTGAGEAGLVGKHTELGPIPHAESPRRVLPAQTTP